MYSTIRTIFTQRQSVYRVITGVLLSLVLFQPALAASLQDLQSQQQKAAADADKYRDLQAAQREKAQTYAGQVQQAAENIASVQTTITSTQRQIRDREQLINQTNSDITQKENQVQKLVVEQNETMISIYEMGGASTLEMVASTKPLSAYSDNTEFFSAIETRLAQVIDEVNRVKGELESKKQTLEAERAQLADLKGQQEAQRRGLEYEKQRQNTLLAQAKELESQYDKLADQAEARKREFDNQIQAALRSRTRFVSKGRVNQGDIVGYMGNTGYSTGAHLHFSVANSSGDWINPASVVGTRGMRWPFNSFYITQGFGRPNWAAAYTFHNGTDMVDNAGYGAPVRAACSGTLVDPFPAYGGYMASGYGRYKAIACDSGYLTLYGHMI